ncbi:hypothetical protein ACWEN3_07955, partial [Streptomyces sp. NPDC004561]
KTAWAADPWGVPTSGRRPIGPPLLLWRDAYREAVEGVGRRRHPGRLGEMTLVLDSFRRRAGGDGDFVLGDFLLGGKDYPPGPAELPHD